MASHPEVAGVITPEEEVSEDLTRRRDRLAQRANL